MTGVSQKVVVYSAGATRLTSNSTPCWRNVNVCFFGYLPAGEIEGKGKNGHATPNFLYLSVSVLSLN